MIAKELLDALNQVQNKSNLNQNAIWALSEYLREAWQDGLDLSVRPFNLGKALSGFFVDLSQHRLSAKISQHTPEMEAILLKTYGSADGSLSQFWTRCAEILKLALEPYPAYAKDFQGYFDLLLQSSLEERSSASPTVAMAGSDEIFTKPPTKSASPFPSDPIAFPEKPGVAVSSAQPNLPQYPVTLPLFPKDGVEPKTFPKNAYLVLQGTRVIPLNQPLIKIGRQLDNHIILEDPRVSRAHAQIKLINDHFVIFDLNSTGGTHINGQRTSQSVLYPGDVISLAGVKFIFSQEVPAKPGEVRIIELGSPYAADRPTAVMHKEKLKPGDKETTELPKTGPLRN